MKGLLTSCCMHWKVIAGLALVGLMIGIIAPSALAAAVPVLIVAICPLSMIYGMRGMMGGAHAQGGHMLMAGSRPLKGRTNIFRSWKWTSRLLTRAATPLSLRHAVLLDHD